MTELAPCPRCKRHVAVRETTCPFCSAAVSGLRAVHHVPASLVRVAVLTAALAGCSDKKAAEPPPAGSAAGSAQGSDDLEKMLDQDVRAAHHDTPADAALDAYAVAEAIDAGVPADAGLSAEEIARQEGAGAQAPRGEAEASRSSTSDGARTSIGFNASRTAHRRLVAASSRRLAGRREVQATSRGVPHSSMRRTANVVEAPTRATCVGSGRPKRIAAPAAQSSVGATWRAWHAGGASTPVYAVSEAPRPHARRERVRGLQSVVASRRALPRAPRALDCASCYSMSSTISENFA